MMSAVIAYLPSELLFHVINEWLSSMRELTAFDIALCNHFLRKKYLLTLEIHKRLSVAIKCEISGPRKRKLLLHWLGQRLMSPEFLSIHAGPHVSSPFTYYQLESFYFLKDLNIFLPELKTAKSRIVIHIDCFLNGLPNLKKLMIANPSFRGEVPLFSLQQPTNPFSGRQYQLESLFLSRILFPKPDTPDNGMIRSDEYDHSYSCCSWLRQWIISCPKLQSLTLYMCEGVGPEMILYMLQHWSAMKLLRYHAYFQIVQNTTTILRNHWLDMLRQNTTTSSLLPTSSIPCCSQLTHLALEAGNANVFVPLLLFVLCKATIQVLHNIDLIFYLQDDDNLIEEWSIWSECIERLYAYETSVKNDHNNNKQMHVMRPYAVLSGIQSFSIYAYQHNGPISCTTLLTSWFHCLSFKQLVTLDLSQQHDMNDTLFSHIYSTLKQLKHLKLGSLEAVSIEMVLHLIASHEYDQEQALESLEISMYNNSELEKGCQILSNLFLTPMMKKLVVHYTSTLDYLYLTHCLFTLPVSQCHGLETLYLLHTLSSTFATTFDEVRRAVDKMRYVDYANKWTFTQFPQLKHLLLQNVPFTDVELMRLSNECRRLESVKMVYEYDRIVMVLVTEDANEEENADEVNGDEDEDDMNEEEASYASSSHDENEDEEEEEAQENSTRSSTPSVLLLSRQEETDEVGDESVSDELNSDDNACDSNDNDYDNDQKVEIDEAEVEEEEGLFQIHGMDMIIPFPKFHHTMIPTLLPPSLRQLGIRGIPFTYQQLLKLLHYCPVLQRLAFYPEDINEDNQLMIGKFLNYLHDQKLFYRLEFVQFQNIYM